MKTKKRNENDILDLRMKSIISEHQKQLIQQERISRAIIEMKSSINSAKKEYLPLSQVILSEKFFNVVMNKQINVRDKEFEDLKNMLNAIYTNDIKTADMICNRYSDDKEWEKMYNYFLNRKIENMQDIMMSLLMTLEWSKNKQVFKFDSDFFKELTETESIIFRRNMLDFLPYNAFYLDLQDIDNRDNIDGIFVNVVKNSAINDTPENYHIRLTMMNKQGRTYYNIVINNNDCEIKNRNLNLNALRELLGITVKEDNLDNSLKIDHNYWDNVILQILTYFCSITPDIQESEETKFTYKKPNENFKPKNKFSEIQKWEVGIRFGSSIRKWEKQKTQEKYNSEISNTNRSKYKPHFRRGHWHSFWCNEIIDGKKTKRLVPKWLSPIFVNKDLCDDVDVVIHKCS